MGRGLGVGVDLGAAVAVGVAVASALPLLSAVAVAVACCRRCWRWAGATASVVAMPYLVCEHEGSSIYAAYTPDFSVSVEPGLVSLAVLRWHIRR